jgi:hypothetical protein
MLKLNPKQFTLRSVLIRSGSRRSSRPWLLSAADYFGSQRATIQTKNIATNLNKFPNSFNFKIQIAEQT